MQTTSIILMNLKMGHLRIPWFTCNRTNGQSDELVLGCRKRGCLEWGYLLSGGPCAELSFDLLETRVESWPSLGMCMIYLNSHL
jgi:hypothetical protein